VITQWIL